MLRQSSSRNYRSKKIRPRHTLQALLFFAVSIWIVYQLTRSYDKRRAVVVETGDGDAMEGGEAARRRLGRKGFADHASVDDIVVGVGNDDVGSEGAGWGSASSDDDPSSKAEDREGGEEDEAADEDDGAGDEEDDGIAGDDEDDDRDFISQNAVVGNSEDKLNTLFGESDRATVFGNGGDDGVRLQEPGELNSSAVPLAKATGRVQDAAASQQTDTTDGAAGHSANVAHLGESPLKNASAVNLWLHDRETAADAAKQSVFDAFAGRATGVENGKHSVSVEDNRVKTKQNETADSVAWHGISS